MPISFPLGNVNCRRCWRPLAHCVCVPTERDMAWLTRAYPGLCDVKARADAGGYQDDRECASQRRLTFTRWLVEQERLGVGDLAADTPLLTLTDFQDVGRNSDAAALSGEGESGGAG